MPVLQIDIESRWAKFQDSLDLMERSTRRTANQLSSAFDGVKTALAAIGVTVGAGMFVGMVKGSIDAADQLDRLTKSTALTVEELAGLKLLAAESGTDLDGIAKGIDKMSVAMGKDPEKFKALGITAKDNKEAFKQFADIFNLLPDIQQRNALSQAVFNKSWAEIAPILALGGKAIGEIMDKGVALSGATKEMSDQAHAFMVQMAELETTLGATKTKLVGDMLPGMNDIATAMREAAKEGGLLTTVWVGLGGVMANLLGQTDAQKLKAQLQGINDQLDAARLRLQSGTTNPEGSNKSFFSFLVPDIKVSDAALAKLHAYIDALEKEKARLTPAEKAVAPAADPAAQAAASALAAAFLKPPKVVSDAMTLFERTMQSLTKEYANLTHEGKLSTIMWEEENGSLQKLTPKEREQVEALAKKFDAYKRDVDMRKMVVVGIEAQVKAQDEATKVATDYQQANKAAIDDLVFQGTLFGKTANEQELLTAARKIDLDARREAAALPMDTEGNMLPGGAGALEKIRSSADKTKAVYAEMIADRQKLDREWATGANAAFMDYIDHATNAAEQAKNFFTDAFKGAEDALTNFVTTGKLDFKSLADSVISNLVRIQIQESITGPIAKAMKDSGGASGLIRKLLGIGDGGMTPADAFAGGVIPMAAGGDFMVSRPTLFLAGEAGLERATFSGANGAGGGAPNVAINVNNQGAPVQLTPQGAPKWDGQQWVIDVVLNRLHTDAGMRDSMRGALGAPA